MKTPIVAAALSIFLFAACDKKDGVTRTDSPPPESPKVEPAAPAKPTPDAETAKPAPKDDIPAKEEAAPTPPPKRLAPEGTYYAITRLSVTTDDGIHSVAAGALLKLVRKTASGLLVKADKVELEVKPEQVTNDLDVAAHIAGLGAQTAAAQSAFDQSRAASGRAQMQQAENANAASMEAGFAAANVRQLQTKKANLEREKAGLQAQLQKNEATAQRRSYAKNVIGRDSTAVTASPADVARWNARIARIDVEVRDIETRISASR